MKTKREIQNMIKVIEGQIADLENEAANAGEMSSEWQDTMSEIFELHSQIKLLLWVLGD